MCAAMLVYLASMATSIGPTFSVHAILTCGIGVALGRYAWLERRTGHDG
jgi:hypothetical protein